MLKGNVGAKLDDLVSHCDKVLVEMIDPINFDAKQAGGCGAGKSLDWAGAGWRRDTGEIL